MHWAGNRDIFLKTNMPGTSLYYHRVILALLLVAFMPTGVWAKTLIGVMIPGNASYYQEMHQAFLAALTTSSGANFEVIIQRPFPDSIAMSNATRKLLAAEPNLIVTYGASATLAVLREKSRVPIIYGGVYDPPAAQISGPNLTGCGYKVPMTSLLRHLRELKTIESLNVLYCSLENDSSRQLEELATLAREQQISLNRIDLKERGDIRKAQLAKGDAIFMTGSVVVATMLDEIVAAAKPHQQPSASMFPDQDEAGMTIALYHDPITQGRKIADLAAQVISGRQPAQIKPETLRSTSLMFNLREAKNMGVKIPFQLVAEAGKVIK